MKLNKFVILIFVLMTPFVVAEISTNLGSSYPLGSAINLGGSCNAPSIFVAFQINVQGTQVWFDQSLTQTDKTFKSVYTPTAGGNYSLYLSCGGEKKSVNFCVGSNCVTSSGTGNGTSGDVPSTIIPPPAPSDGGGGCSSNWNCTKWSACNSSSKQSRNCVDLKKCKQNVTEVQNCTFCAESWVCSIWSPCNYGTQDRTCTDLHLCGTTQFKPVEQKGCQEFVAPIQQVYTPPPPPPSEQGFVAELKQAVTEKTISIWDKYMYYILGLAAFVVLAVFVIVLILVLRKPKQVYNLDELKDWVVKERQMGTSDGDIKTILAQSTGWKEPEIRQAFGELGA
jgi:uncharacterized membrane protein YgcG